MGHTPWRYDADQLALTIKAAKPVDDSILARKYVSSSRCHRQLEYAIGQPTICPPGQPIFTARPDAESITSLGAGSLLLCLSIGAIQVRNLLSMAPWHPVDVIDEYWAAMRGAAMQIEGRMLTNTLEGEMEMSFSFVPKTSSITYSLYQDMGVTYLSTVVVPLMDVTRLVRSILEFDGLRERYWNLDMSSSNLGPLFYYATETERKSLEAVLNVYKAAKETSNDRRTAVA